MNLKLFLQTKTLTPAGFVSAPEFGADAKIPVRQLTLGERKLVQEIASEKDKPTADKYLELIPICVCDEEGRQVYLAGEAEILNIPGSLADRIIKAAIEYSTNKADEAKKD